PEDSERRAGSAHPDWWTGDAWKLIPVLRAHRPDLTLRAFDAQPSGLLAATGLDPASTLLADRFETIVARYRDLSAAEEAELFAQSQAGLTVHSTTELLLTLAPERHNRPEPAAMADKKPYRFIDPAHLPRIDVPALLAGTSDGRQPEEPDVPRTYF